MISTSNGSAAHAYDCVAMAARAPDPHNLHQLARKATGVIEADRECAGCGYNLRGLRLGANCPECGMPTVAVSDIDDPLSLMPTRVILAFIRGCWVASIGVGALVAVVIASRFAAWNRLYLLCGLAAIALLWVGATVWLTPAFSLPQAVARGFSQASKMRKAARRLQWGWVLAAGSTALIALLSNPSTAAMKLLSLAQWIGMASGMVGIVVLSILLERLSEWARDGDAEKMFNWAAWGLPIATLMLLADISNPILRLLTTLMWLVMACTFPYGLLSLSKSVTLSILHSIEYRERVHRRDERTRQYHQHVADAVATMDSAHAHKSR